MDIGDDWFIGGDSPSHRGIAYHGWSSSVSPLQLVAIEGCVEVDIRTWP